MNLPFLFTVSKNREFEVDTDKWSKTYGFILYGKSTALVFKLVGRKKLIIEKRKVKYEDQQEEIETYPLINSIEIPFRY